MVRLNRIYTRTGDDGTTGLGGGARVSKSDLRVEAYGTVDEANAALGLAAAAAGTTPPQDRIAALLKELQNDLFDAGADLCLPMDKGEAPGARLRVTPAQTARLEPIIDEFNQALSPLKSFVLPGGTPLAAALHLARTVTRRAERLCVALRQREPHATNPETVRYLNRLSDLLFVLARAANQDGPGDVLWTPGAGRPGRGGTA